MAKDPAILFYTSDFLTGTMLMNHEQVGKYIRLLCLQHQKKILSEKDMMKICDSYDEDIWNKFEKTDEGFYNKRMKEEIEKRTSYSESRRNNRKKKNEEEDMKNISKTYVKHMENENENENRDTIIDDNRNNNSIEIIKEKEKINKKEKENSLHSKFIEIYYNWFVDLYGFKPKMIQADFKAVKEILKYVASNTEGDEEKMLEFWNAIFKNWNRLSEFYQNKSTLRDINSNLTKLILEIKASYQDKSIGKINKAYNDLIEQIKNE